MGLFCKGTATGVLLALTLFFTGDFALGGYFRLPTCLRPRAPAHALLLRHRLHHLALLAPPAAAPSLRWFTSINDDAFTPLLGAALRSAAEFHPPGTHRLLPRIVIPPSPAMPATQALAARYNATLVRHEVLFAPALRHHMLDTQGMSQGEVGIALATFVRVDAAVLAAAESLGRSPEWVRQHSAQAARAMADLGAPSDLVLYTDSDMLFLGPVAQDIVEGSVPCPGAFAVRRDSLRSTRFNPAVMLLRVSRYLLLYEDIVGLWEATGYACVRQAWDQGCLNLYVAQQPGMIDSVGVLPPELHTVPYDSFAEGSPPTRILHFHGPKPDMLLGFLEGASATLEKEGYSGFVTLRPAGYLKALMLYAAMQDAGVAGEASGGGVNGALVPWCKAHPGIVPC